MAVTRHKDVRLRSWKGGGGRRKKKKKGHIFSREKSSVKQIRTNLQQHACHSVKIGEELRQIKLDEQSHPYYMCQIKL